MDQARQVLPTALAQAVRLAPLTPEKIDFAWRAAGGAPIARVTAVALGDGGVLTVKSADAHWAKEVHRLRHALVRSLETWLGAGVVTTIEVAGPNARRSRRAGTARIPFGE